MKYLDVLKTLVENKNRREYPDRDDPRYTDNFIIPGFTPKFNIDWATTNSVFTIGSCFARHIEPPLEAAGARVPTMAFVAPVEEYDGDALPRAALNEYNPGTISQKIMLTLRREEPPNGTLYEQHGLYWDLLLAGVLPVSYARATERREDLQKIYEHLHQSDVVVITLGYVESWYDQDTRCWLNKMPPYQKNKDLNRYVFKRLDIDDAMPMLTEALGALSDVGKKIVLTVSPVPLHVTMTKTDCVLANEFSKSVLRICADRLSTQIKNVDYYPSYEMVRTAGLVAYDDDNIHVTATTVARVTKYMIDSYQNANV